MTGNLVRRMFRRREDRRGSATVEFAVVAPLLFLLTCGMIEFGRSMMVQQVLTNASREGARTGVVGDATTQDVVDVVEAYTAGGKIASVDVTVTPDPPSSAAYGDPISVTVSVPFSQVGWLPTPWFMGDATLSATSVMRRESLD